MHKTLSIKIVVVTFRRPELLKKLVSSLKSCVTSKLSLEYIFIINGDDQNTKNYLVETQYPFQEIKQTTPAAARNIALEKISTDYILFLDDDVCLPNDYFEKLASALTEYQPDIIGGPEISEQHAKAIQKAYGFCQAQWPVTGSTYRRHQRDMDVMTNAGETDLILCNLCIRSNVFSEGHLFNPSFERNEENELFFRLKKLGKRFVRDGKLFVYHDKKQSLKKIITACLKSGRYRFAVFKQHPMSLNLQYLVPLLSLLYFLNLIFFPTRVLFMPLQLYLLGCFLLAVKSLNESKDFKLSIYVLLLIPTIHLSYAIGLVQGLIYRTSSKVSH